MAGYPRRPHVPQSPTVTNVSPGGLVRDSRIVYRRPTMMMRPEIEEQDDGPTETVTLDLPLDRKTMSWLAKLAVDGGEAGAVVASMLRMIRIDDEAAHATMH